MRIHWILVASALIASCASRPHSPPAVPVVAQNTVPAAVNPVATVQEARLAGNKIVDQDGATVYCREQLKTGSHLRKELICLTAEQLEAARDASKRNLDQMQRRIPPPHGT
jgi:hypothetical protein